MYRVVQGGQSRNTEQRGISRFNKPESKPSVRYIGRKRYKVKAFAAGRRPSSASKTRFVEIDNGYMYEDGEKPQCTFEFLKPFEEIENSPPQADRNASRPEYNPLLQLENARYYESLIRPKKRSWWQSLMPKALVFLFVLIVMFFLFRPIPSSAEDSGPLSMNLPQVLSKMLPQLNLFVQATGDDMIKIGKSYTSNKAAVTQSADPNQPLEGLISGIKDLNKEMGNADSENSIWNQVQEVFKNIRLEAWSRATQSAK